jgi:hypothetical protein
MAASGDGDMASVQAFEKAVFSSVSVAVSGHQASYPRR